MAFVDSHQFSYKDVQVDLQPQLEEEAIKTNVTGGSDAKIEDTNDVIIAPGFNKDDKNNVEGMVFDNPDDAYEFYNQYAFLHGFGIRKFTTFKNKTTGEHYRKKYVCNKEGFKYLKSNSSSGDVKKRRRDLRTGCEAFIRISKSKDGKWMVDMFNDVHNHELIITPTKVIKYCSHGKFHRSMACKSLMSELGQAGLKPCQIKKVINTVKSPLENDVTSKQCADILAKERKEYKGREFYGLIKHFQDKVLEDRNLYFVVDLFDDGSPRNIFWADGRSRDQYIKFGDVLVFDVTYMTNKFKAMFGIPYFPS